MRAAVYTNPKRPSLTLRVGVLPGSRTLLHIDVRDARVHLTPAASPAIVSPLSSDSFGKIGVGREAVRIGYWLALGLLLLGCAVGCTLPAHVRGPSWIDRLRAGTAVDPNTVLVETALIERPLGDSYINRELWQDTDELVVGLERREALQANGLRVGRLVGTPPAGFQTLLLSPRYCANPQHLVVPSGKQCSTYLGPVLAHCSVDLAL